MSKAKTGSNNPSFGRTGDNNQMSGIIPANARPVLLYFNDVLVREFSSMVEAAQWLNVSRFTLMRHVKSGKVLNGEYIIRLSRKL